ncbi:hypothetical protein NL676_004001 [Syzygium grande]|nr:hypothetical protein NL676_004001 [Syzygium grande]
MTHRASRSGGSTPPWPIESLDLEATPPNQRRRQHVEVLCCGRPRDGATVALSFCVVGGQERGLHCCGGGGSRSGVAELNNETITRGDGSNLFAMVVVRTQEKIA